MISFKSLKHLFVIVNKNPEDVSLKGYNEKGFAIITAKPFSL